MNTPSIPLTTADDRPSIIGINFGNSYASIAVITKEGKAECIANEDGERQIAAAISFHGEEMYIGNQATPQLVKNAENTIIGFRNLLGKSFSEISRDPNPTITPSASIIQHPSLSDTPCYAIQVLVPSPAPLLSLRNSSTPSATPPPSSRPSTQNPTPLATPRSEPIPQTRYITPHEAATLFLKSLHQSATDFLGKSPEGAVLTVPAWFSEAQRCALQAAAKEAGINVLQLLEEGTAAVSALLDVDNQANQQNGGDRTALLVDWGATELSVILLSVRAGFAHVLASGRAPELGTACSGSVDEILIKHFAKEFSKKHGETLQVCPPNAASARAQIKLALALVHVKRSLTTANTATSTPSSSQPKSTQISIESLHNGLDFSAALNRTRATGLISSVFTRFANFVRNVLDSADGPGVPWSNRGIWVDSLVWVGGAGRMGTAGASAALISSGVLGEDIREEDIGDPEEALARGCALHGREITLKDADQGMDARDVLATRQTVGMVFPQSLPSKALANGDAKHSSGGERDSGDMGGQWIPVIPAETPLPARRTVRFPVAFSPAQESSNRAIFEVWEVSEVVRVCLIPQAVDLGDVSDDEDSPPDEERRRSLRKEQYFGAVELQLSPSKPVKKAKDGTGKFVEVRFDMDLCGVLEVRAREEGRDWVKMNSATG